MKKIGIIFAMEEELNAFIENGKTTFQINFKK
jgi:hypothetical protein